MKKVNIFCHSFQKVKPKYYVMEAGCFDSNLQFYPAGCCLLSWPSLPRRPGSGHRAGCLSRCWRSGSVWWGWWCCVWWVVSWLHLLSRCPRIMVQHPETTSLGHFQMCLPWGWRLESQATASSGLMLLFKSLPLNKSCRSFCIFEILVDPQPT